MKAKKKAWIVIIVLAVIGFCVGFYFGYKGKKDKQEQTNTQTRTQEKEIRAQGEMKDGELVDYTKNDMLELGKYKGRTVTVTPTETEVYQAILLEAEDWKKKVADGERVEKGDWISLDYEGYVDDQPSDDLSESGAVIQVGAGNLFNAAFERGLMGLKLGETYNLNVTFAEDDADPDVAGKTITFSVEVKAKFNDAYAKKMSKNKYPNVKAYYTYAKAKEEKENREGIGDTVWEDLLKECNVKKYPAGSRKQAYKDQKRSYQVFAKVSGQSYEEFIGALGQTDEDIQSSADDQVKARMTAKTIAIKEGLTLSDADYERFLLAFLEPEEEEDKTLKAMEKRYIEEQSCYPRDDMLIELVKEYLGKNSKMK